MPRHKLTAFELKLRETISANLKKVSGGISQQQLSDMTGIPASTISGYFAKRSTPNPGAIQKIADALKVNKSDIDPRFTTSIFEEPADILPIYNQLHPTRQQNVYTYAEKQLNEQQNENVVPFPVAKREESEKENNEDFPWYGCVSAGLGEMLYQDEEVSETISIPSDNVPDGADFCLTVDGDSMEPVFPNGSYVFVKKQDDLYDGAIGVVIVNDEAFLKRVWFEKHDIRLESLNDHYEDKTITDDDTFHIVGKVVI